MAEESVRATISILEGSTVAIEIAVIISDTGARDDAIAVGVICATAEPVAAINVRLIARHSIARCAGKNAFHCVSHLEPWIGAGCKWTIDCALMK